MDLHQIVYSSRPDPSMSLSEVDTIVTASQKWNAIRGITGRLLVIVDDADALVAFMQWIEGPPLAIRACLKRIVADPRRHGVRVVQDASVAERSYREWSMAQEVVSPDRVESALASAGLAGHVGADGGLVLDVDGELVDGGDSA